MSGLGGWKLEAVGAYFAFVRHPFPGKTSVEVAEQLARQAGILAIPGEYFGVGHTQFLRFAFANADSATIRQLRGRMVDFSI